MAKVPRNSPGGCPTVRVLGMVHASLEFVTTIPLKCPVALPWMVAGAAPRALRCGCMVMWEEAKTPTSIPSVQGAYRHHVIPIRGPDAGQCAEKAPRRRCCVPWNHFDGS